VIQFSWIKGHYGVEVNETAGLEAKQSIKECRGSQILLLVADLKAQWKQKGKEKLHVFVKTPKDAEEKAILEGTTGMARFHGSARSNWTVVPSCWLTV
jgi:hypothetical protein